MAWVEILPRFTSRFRRLGWDSAASFLGWTGVLVNRHRHRQVEHVALPEDSTLDYYVKKETAVSWHDCFRNAWHGFGWCATTTREGAMLQALRVAGIGCPEVVALGEDGRQAFLVTRAENTMIELRDLLPTLDDDGRKCLAEALGCELARMHNAGFEHPDLFAKHILVGTVKPQESLRSSWGLRFCILDWQRGLQRRTVPWRVRCRDLAILDATLHRVLASDRVRLRCLRAYLASQPDAPPLGRLAREIRRLAMKRQQDRHIREVGQLPVAAHDQQFVPIDNGRVLVVRSFFEEHADQTLDWRTMPDSSLYTWLNVGERWDIPPLAHTLFRLQRFHVFAPRLMAVGHDGTHTFLLSEAIATLPFVEAYAKAGPGRRAQMLQDAGRLIRQIHDAGYHLPAPESWEHQLGIVAETGAVKLVKVEALQAGKGAWQELGPLEFARRSIRLSRTEQLRFMQSYLEHTAPRARAVKERQATP